MVSVERVEYVGTGLDDDEVADAPWGQLRSWLDDAAAAARAGGQVVESTAMAVATVDAAGLPNVRTVLLRLVDERGLGFVTSTESTKASEIAANPWAAVTLAWPALYRAVRARGAVARVAAEEVDSYFLTRPWGARISAWASRQSAPVAGRADLQAAFERYAAQWPDHGRPDDVPVPPDWCGYRVIPDEVEFWAGQPNRLHDRIVFTRVGEGSLADAGAWARSRRQP